MERPVISAKNLGKRYLLGSGGGERYRALRDVMANTVKNFFNRNNRNVAPKEIWALKNVDFDICAGEKVGVIGRNGAGKSTLLKVLSEITEPTEGEVHIYGRVASLLEVGTGFHPELTGKENIFMNGAIMGMRRAEIKKKFDEIVAFAEIEKFLDTPVKRYSSGMYVRLAFAVAAHLEPEILLIDEVLAVGDMQFQKKCLGKMEEISTKEGRTILFVSHNMGAVQSLCSRAILLRNGEICSDGPAAAIVSEYLTGDYEMSSVRLWNDIDSAPGDDYVRMNSIRVMDKDKNTSSNFDVRDPICVELGYWVLKEMKSLNTSCCFYNERGEIAFHSRNDTMNLPEDEQTREPGFYVSTCCIPGDFMNNGQYFVQIAVTDEVTVHFFERDAVSFNVLDAMDPEGVRQNYMHEWPPAAVRPMLAWDNRKYSLSRRFDDSEKI